MKIENIHVVSILYYMLAAVFIILIIAMIKVYFLSKRSKRNSENLNRIQYDREPRHDKAEYQYNSPVTTKLDECQVSQTAYTTKLSPSQLVQETDKTNQYSQFTSLESNNVNESSAKTAVLANADVSVEMYSPVNAQPDFFSIDYEIMYTMSSEIIR